MWLFLVSTGNIGCPVKLLVYICSFFLAFPTPPPLTTLSSLLLPKNSLYSSWSTDCHPQHNHVASQNSRTHCIWRNHPQPKANSWEFSSKVCRAASKSKLHSFSLYLSLGFGTHWFVSVITPRPPVNTDPAGFVIYRRFQGLWDEWEETRNIQVSRSLPTHQAAEMSNKWLHPAMKLNSSGRFKGGLDLCLRKKPEAAAATNWTCYFTVVMDWSIRFSSGLIRASLKGSISFSHLVYILLICKLTALDSQSNIEKKNPTPNPVMRLIGSSVAAFSCHKFDVLSCGSCSKAWR